MKLEDLLIENGKYVIELSEPIQAYGELTTKLLLEKPRMKHLKRIDSVKGDISQTVALLAILANVPNSAVEEITIADIRQRVEPVLDALMGESQKTGEPL